MQYGKRRANYDVNRRLDIRSFNIEDFQVLQQKLNLDETDYRVFGGNWRTTSIQRGFESIDIRFRPSDTPMIYISDALEEVEFFKYQKCSLTEPLTETDYFLYANPMEKFYYKIGLDSNPEEKIINTPNPTVVPMRLYFDVDEKNITISKFCVQPMDLLLWAFFYSKHQF